MTIATVGKRYQVVIPLKERKKLNIKPNSKVEVTAEKDKLVIYLISPASFRGIGRDLSDEIDATDYVKKIRREWEERADAFKRS
ncbi:MAG: AbrB/MazE/SpoVT family DNA-binding domain-containing protein [Desulfobacterales bacterium]|jgi:AbrB family looped-hinge helix DNA binding protein